MAKESEIRLRCYARRSGKQPEKWLAHCVDLDVWAVGSSFEEAKSGLEGAIAGYVKTVLNTTDVASIPRLLRKRAPLRYIALWHLISLLVAIRDNQWPLNPRVFSEPYLATA